MNANVQRSRALGFTFNSVNKVGKGERRGHTIDDAFLRLPRQVLECFPVRLLDEARRAEARERERDEHK